jgi:hypothetical protein
MPITTYIQDKSVFITDDKDINEWLPKDYYVEKIFIPRLFLGLFWREPLIKYQLLYDCYKDNGIEYQIINFYAPPEENSINTLVTKEVLLACLLGMQMNRTPQPNKG